MIEKTFEEKFNDMTFSMNSNDSDGDVYEEGIYLHFGDVRIRVGKNIDDYENFIAHLEHMKKEIEENLWTRN